MGAQDFYEVASKKDYPTAVSAFEALVKSAQYDHGHAGYTGTIAEKGGFTKPVVIPDEFAGDWNDIISSFDWPEDTDTVTPLAQFCIDKYGRTKYDDMIGTWNDKWGAALCLETSTKWIFTGLASS